VPHALLFLELMLLLFLQTLSLPLQLLFILLLLVLMLQLLKNFYLPSCKCNVAKVFPNVVGFTT